MANRKQREVQFTLKDEDYKAFGRYRIMYTEQGHKMVRQQRLTYLLTAAMIAILFTVFKVDRNFTILIYAVCVVLAVIGLFFAEKLVLRQQDKAIESDSASADRVHAGENKIRFDEDTFTASGNGDEQTFAYKDIKLIDFTEAAIYVWMSDTMIMSIPDHAFRNMSEMKELNKWLKEKAGLAG